MPAMGVIPAISEYLAHQPQSGVGCSHRVAKRIEMTMPAGAVFVFRARVRFIVLWVSAGEFIARLLLG